MNILDTIMMTFTNMDFLSAIASTVFIILLGYYCRVKGIFNENTSKVLSGVVLRLAIPCLAFNAFMKDVDYAQLRQSMDILIWGHLFLIILIFLTKPIFAKYQGVTKMVLSNLAIFGSTTFFGIPIISAVFGDEGVIYANIFNIGYRVLLYSFCYLQMSGLEFDKDNLKQIFLNPVIIFTFAGLLIWVFQDSLPQVMVEGESYAFLRLDMTAPWLNKPMTYLGSLSSPLAWLAIGSTLGGISFKEAAKDSRVWYYSAVKQIVVPLLNIALILVFNAIGLSQMGYIAIATTVVMMATPPATVAVNYAIGFDKEPVLASNSSLVSTLMAVIAIPVWLIILQMLMQGGLI
ncbi:AEC family transporter [Streptococcus pluranimalium]|uniref:AEC family transporter n=1 Tax=Streptococcus pluranimalium TaxID=82348 RepID=UPI0039FC78B7